jgi:hypothetical protein
MQVLAPGNHTLNVKYDPQSREDGVVRYLFLYYFLYNEPSEYVLTLNKLSACTDLHPLASSLSTPHPTPHPARRRLLLSYNRPQMENSVQRTVGLPGTNM